MLVPVFLPREISWTLIVQLVQEKLQNKEIDLEQQVSARKQEEALAINHSGLDDQLEYLLLRNSDGTFNITSVQRVLDCPVRR